MTTVLLTGGTGFVGQHVTRALLEHPASPEIRLLVHRTPPATVDHRLLPFEADLGVPASLGGICGGVDAVIHLASYLGGDDAQCTRINAEGTEALADLARGAGAHRFVYLSNAAVYGWASHSGAAEDDVTVAPATPISRSRARAERAVSAVAGTIVRPLFVDGEGDTRFVPTIMRALRRTPFLIGGGRARLSTISVQDLARAVVALTLSVPAPTAGGVFHANDQCPVSFREMAEQITREFGGHLPRLSVPYQIGRTLLRWRADRSLGTATWTASAAHRLFLVSHDHWYDSERLWGLLGWAPSSSFCDRLPAAHAWYQRLADRGMS
jgi:nucleoside-diphosphate-sugar epimerase